MRLYLVEGKSLAEVRRELNKEPGRSVSAERLKSIVAKAGRKSLFYSNYYDQRSVPLQKLLRAGDPIDHSGCCVFCEASIVKIGKGEQPLLPHLDDCVWWHLFRIANPDQAAARTAPVAIASQNENEPHTRATHDD